MKYGKYRFNCRWIDPGYLPPFQGSMFRGALGTALKEVTCIIREERSCHNCLLLKQCVYASIFEEDNLPHPYMVLWEPTQAGSYSKGEPFIFSLVLFGEFTQYLPHLIMAIRKMGERGLGAKARMGRKPTFTLESVEYAGRIVYSSVTQKLTGKELFEVLKLDSTPHPLSSHLCIKLITPLRMKTENRFTRDLNLELLLKAVIRRIKQLWEAHSDEVPEIDMGELLNATRQIETIASNLIWKEQKRYSNRQKSEMKFGGLSGDIHFKGDFSLIAPYLKLGEKLQIGKATSFGLGRYQTIFTEQKI